MVCLLALIYFFNLLLLDSHARPFYPSFEGDPEVHDRQERVYVVVFFNDVLDHIFVREFAHFVLKSMSFLEYLVLGSKLNNLHLFVYLHITILIAHAPVK